ncbi:hypothetical protein QOT17_020538 [Balamuthia mandrillaris]
MADHHEAFEGLLNQISELEKAQRQEEVKLFEEKQKHAHTQQELKKAEQLGESWKQKYLELKETLSQTETKLATEQKANVQLKGALKLAKQENQLLREHDEKQTAEFKQKREEFLNVMKNTNDNIRELHSLYKKKAVVKRLEQAVLEVEQLKEELGELRDGNKTNADLIKELQRLKTELGETQQQKDQLSQRLMDVLQERMDVVSSTIDEDVSLGEDTSHADTVTLEMKETKDEEKGQEKQTQIEACQQEALRKRIVELEAAIEEHKSVHESTIKEFHDLDEYAQTLASNLEELQAAYDALQEQMNAQECPQCGFILHPTELLPGSPSLQPEEKEGAEPAKRC